MDRRSKAGGQFSRYRFRTVFHSGAIAAGATGQYRQLCRADQRPVDRRTGNQPIAEWVRGLPASDVGLSTLDRWPGGATAVSLATATENQLRQQIAGPGTGPQFGGSMLDQIRAEGDNIKIGYAMGSLAASIEQRIADNPGVPSENAAQFAAALRDRGMALSHGASAEASANPAIFTYRNQCYTSDNALVSAVVRDQANTPQLREYTPAMQQRDQLAAMDRAVADQYTPGLGYSWGQTAYMYARAGTTDMAALNRAHAAGTLLDAGIGLGGARAGVSAARQGASLPGGQSGVLVPRRGNVTPLEPAGPSVTRMAPPSGRTPASAIRPPAQPVRAPDQFDTQARNVAIDMPHILQGHLNAKGKAVGFHSRPGGTDPVTSRMTSQIDAPNAQGVYTGKVEVRASANDPWVAKKGMSSFYPDRMSGSDVEAVVRTAYADALRQGYAGSGRFSGDSGQGFRIEGFADNGKIATAYPLYK